MQQIKTAILRSQAKALAGVNQEQLALYYGIGRYISKNSRGGFWGKDAIATDETILADASAKSEIAGNLAVATAKLNADDQLMVFPIANVPVAAFFSIGFTHHTTILSKVKTQEERYFYIQLCHDRSLTVDELEQLIAAGAYAHRGNIGNRRGGGKRAKSFAIHE